MSFTEPVSIPHFAFPFSISLTEGVGTVEQGSVGEIQSNVLMIISCATGDCPELPSFGIPDPTFQDAPPSSAAIVAAVAQFEPRASLDVVTSILNLDPSQWQMSVTASVANTGGQ